ncbi:peptidyl-alpha-hydroxyglycine alpha-amidating lyase family protein [Opitutia bacterium ISCC 51]|nr:peptidyl-alpha-hydroxyglycine alpha-amidating lyase family protein [Opitutae bacterium ISCC 51]QXD29594.1 peptidyl-alpha-hydroxyglycine alpha-amidating lyase family protein [Opitutae bacterium ISCC 52]
MRIVFVILIMGIGPFILFGQTYPNPYRAVDTWATFPDGRKIGAVGDVQVDPDGVHIWAVVRCDSAERGRFGNECLDSDLDPIVKFDAEGNAVESFGGGMFIWPHGLFVDEESNVWVTDAVKPSRTPEGTRGHQVIKFSSTGEELMRLGIPGKAGKGDYQFNSPADVVIGDNGNIFIADGHNPDGNNRVMVYNKDGEFLRSWGQTGYAPGEFHALHAMAIDKKGRLFIADRFNNRLQIFDQDGTFIAQWTQFGRPSGVFFDDHGNIYVSDSESDNVQNPGYEMGIRIGDAETGWVNYFIMLPNGDPRFTNGNGAEFVTVDAAGNVYGGEPFSRTVQKYVRVRP